MTLLRITREHKVDGSLNVIHDGSEHEISRNGIGYTCEVRDWTRCILLYTEKGGSFGAMAELVPSSESQMSHLGLPTLHYKIDGHFQIVKDRLTPMALQSATEEFEKSCAKISQALIAQDLVAQLDMIRLAGDNLDQKIEQAKLLAKKLSHADGDLDDRRPTWQRLEAERRQLEGIFKTLCELKDEVAAFKFPRKLSTTDKLHRHMVARRITRTQFAEALNVDLMTACMWIDGHKFIKEEHLHMMAAALNKLASEQPPVSADDLRADEDS